MMATPFAEVQFPVNISYGAVGGPGFHTTILTLASGFERRNIDWSLARGTWDLSQGLKTQQELDQLLDFFYARFGRAIGFRFKDWSDYRSSLPGENLQTLGVTGGGVTEFQITKTYGDAGGSYVRPILKPVAGTFMLYVNNEPSADFTIDTTTGLVTPGSDLTSDGGLTLTYYCEFDVPVRFDTDQMKTKITDYNVFDWEQITIIELRAGD
jgi:uncharacterized protein (TIGR02217 family)